MKLDYVIWIILAAITSAIPVAAAKQFSLKKELIWIIISLISSGLMICCYLQLFQSKSDIGSLYPLIKCFSIGFLVITGMLYFNETMTYRKALGLVLGSVAIYLLATY